MHSRACLETADPEAAAPRPQTTTPGPARNLRTQAITPRSSAAYLNDGLKLSAWVIPSSGAGLRGYMVAKLQGYMGNHKHPQILLLILIVILISNPDGIESISPGLRIPRRSSVRRQ